MEKIRKNLALLALSVLALVTVTLSSCSDDDSDPTPVAGDPTIAVSSGFPGNPQVAPGGSLVFSIAVTAEGKLAAVELDGTAIKSYTTDAIADAFTYTYNAPAAEPVGNKTLTFKVKDKSSTVQESTVAVTVVVTASPKEVVTVTANITTATTWSANKYYILKGNIFVTSPAKLTIAPGTIIFGDKVTKGALIIERGASIDASGTAANPIVFTSIAPAGFRNYGDWGGVVLLGKADNNKGTDVNIEGITAGDLGKYGRATAGAGETDNDNTGIFKYVRVEFAGIALSTDNELNGVTLGSVGSATEFHHVQVSYSGDDSFEWFGGKVNANHLIAYRGWDDDFDTDFGFSGKIQYAASFRDPNIADKSGSNGFESDNNGDGTDTSPKTSPTFANVTVFGPFVFANLSSGALANGNVSANYQNGGHIRRYSALKLYNSVFIGYGTVNNAAFRLTDSKGGSDGNATFKKNFIGRTLGSLTLPTTGANDHGFDVTNFATDNIVSSPLNKVDLSDVFTGLTGAADITNPAPTAVPAAASVLLTGALDLSATGLDLGLDKTDYVGAVGANNWLTETWVNFGAQNTQY